MIPKQAVQKAIEGGWLPKNTWGTTKGVKINDNLIDACVQYWHYTALNPTFWQALDKVEGWHHTGPAVPEKEAWHYIASRFLDLILTGGDTGKFWDDLLK